MKFLFYLLTIVLAIAIFFLATETDFEGRMKNNIKSTLIGVKDFVLERIYKEATEHNPSGDVLPDEIDDKIKEEVKKGLKKF